MARYRVRDEKLLKQAPCGEDGGWIRPDAKALQAFYDRIQDEAVREFGVDCDGDAVVLVRIVDNTRHESGVLNYEPLPRPIEDDSRHPYSREQWNMRVQDPITKKWSEPTHTPEEEEARTRAILENEEWRRRMISLNFALAQGEVERLMRKDAMDLRDRIEAPQKKREARIKELEALQEKWKDIFAYYEGRGCYEIDRETRTYWYCEEARSGEDKRLNPVAKRYSMGNKPENFDELMKELKALKKYKPAKESKY